MCILRALFRLQNIQEKMAELELQHSNLQELLATLKDTKSSAAKVMEWHAKLGEMRLQVGR